jgi:nicotinamidase-related amidase
MKTADILEIPIVVTEQYPKGLGSTISDLELPKFPRASVFAKTQFSMLTDEVLNHFNSIPDFSRESDNWTFLICGIEAHVCVLQTALDLRGRGHRVQVLADATSSRHDFERHLAFRHLAQAGAVITTIESAAFQLMRSSTHPHFKKIQSLFLGGRPDTGLMPSSRVDSS